VPTWARHHRSGRSARARGGSADRRVGPHVSSVDGRPSQFGGLDTPSATVGVGGSSVCPLWRRERTERSRVNPWLPGAIRSANLSNLTRPSLTRHALMVFDCLGSRQRCQRGGRNSPFDTPTAHQIGATAPVRWFMSPAGGTMMSQKWRPRPNWAIAADRVVRQEPLGLIAAPVGCAHRGSGTPPCRHSPRDGGSTGRTGSC
jgi:hypothetical protein